MYKLEESNPYYEESNEACVRGIKWVARGLQRCLDKKPVDRKILLNFAPLKNCDIERSFSLYRHILSDNLKPENVAKSNFVNFNAQKLE